MRDRAAEIGIPFDGDYFTVAVLTVWIANNRRCGCCNAEFDLSGNDRNRSHSVDRFIPSAGYVRGNVAIICWRCNNLKRDASAVELQAVVDWMRRIGGNQSAVAA